MRTRRKRPGMLRPFEVGCDPRRARIERTVPSGRSDAVQESGTAPEVRAAARRRQDFGADFRRVEPRNGEETASRARGEQEARALTKTPVMRTSPFSDTRGHPEISTLSGGHNGKSFSGGGVVVLRGWGGAAC